MVWPSYIGNNQETSERQGYLLGVLDLTDSSFEVVNTERVLQPALQ